MLNGRLYRAAFVPFVLALGDRRLLAAGAPAAAHLDARARRVRRRARVRRTAAAWPRVSRSGARAAPATKNSPRTSRRRSKGSAAPPAAASRCTRYRFDAQTIDGERTLTDGDRAARRLDERRADPDRRAPRRRRRAASPRNCPGRPRCWSSRACSPRARPSARSSSPRPAAAAAATPGAQLLSGGELGGAAIAGSPGRRSTRRSCSATSPAAHERKPIVVPYSDGVGSAPLAAAAHGRRAITQKRRHRPRRAEHARPARAPGVPAERRRTGRARRARRAGRARAGLRRTRPVAAATPVSGERLEVFGRAVLSAVDALDTAPDVAAVDADRPRAGSARRCPPGYCGCSC